MSDKDLQRVTESLPYIGQAVLRRPLPNRRNHITQKVRIARQRTPYPRARHDNQPGEILLRLKGSDCSSELIGFYDVIARLMSLALQYDLRLENVGDRVTSGGLSTRSGRKAGERCC